MSIHAMTTLAVARNRRQPGKRDIAERTSDSAKADEQPSLPAILAKTIPTGLVTAYTAFIAVVSEVVKKPTAEMPNPDKLLDLRWAGFAVLVVAAAIVTFLSYAGKAEKGSRPPLLETAAVLVAAAGWGLALPESPLLATIDDTARGTITIALIGLAAVAVNSVLSAMLKKPAGG